MHDEQRARAHDLLRRQGIDRALFSDSASVTWLSGYAEAVQCGLSPFVASPPLLWYAGGEYSLIVNADAQLDEVTIPICSFPGYRFAEPLPGRGDVSAAAFAAIGSDRPARIGVELRSLPTWMAQLLHSTGADLVAIDDVLLPARAVKTAEELRTLRRAFQLADVGHVAARQATAVGQREIDIWTAIQTAVEQDAGARVAIGNDCVVGYRQENSGGWPLTWPLRPGDSLVVDLGVRWGGYWSDSCATYYADAPRPWQLAAHRAVAEALELAISLVRPGVRAGDIDVAVRTFLGQAGYPSYPHHTGHGVGVSGHEAPRIVPYSDEILETGMVIMLEPGIYWPGRHGVRLEDGVLVTETGALRLTTHIKEAAAAKG
jgi:Xaa-Pro aminopeptidase